MNTDADARLRATWHQAADALPAGLQGRVRAARRDALQGPKRASAPRLAWWGIPTGAVAAVAAVALLLPALRTEAPLAPVHVAVQQAATGRTSAETATELPAAELLALEDDPDFYLWLDGINTPPAGEARHDPT